MVRPFDRNARIALRRMLAELGVNPEPVEPPPPRKPSKSPRATPVFCPVKLHNGQPYVVPPYQFLPQAKNFINSWHTWMEQTQRGVEIDPLVAVSNAEQAEGFFDKLQDLCSKFKYYNRPGTADFVAELNELIMNSIMWKYLDLKVRRQRLRAIFQQKDFRLQFWRHFLYMREFDRVQIVVMELKIDAQIAPVLLRYDDILAEFMSLTIGRIVDVIKAPGVIKQIIKQIPTFFSRLSQEQQKELLGRHPELASSILMAIARYHPKELTFLLNTSKDVRNFFGYNKLSPLMIMNVLPSLDAYLQSLFVGDSSLITRGVALKESSILGLVEQFTELPLLPGICLLIQDYESKRGANRKFYQLGHTQEQVRAFVQSTYDGYFHQPDEFSANIALQTLTLLAEQANQDPIARFKAHFFVAEIYMNQHKWHQAQPHLDALKKAGNVLTAEQHQVILSYQLLTHSKKAPFVNGRAHIAYLEPEDAAFFKKVCKDQPVNILKHHQQVSALHDQIAPFVARLTIINTSLGGYLAKRNTDSFSYFFGIKNTALSTYKNELVKQVRIQIAESLEELATVESVADFRKIVEGVLGQLSYAEQLNKGLYKQYGRVIDSAGQLGGDLRKACEMLGDLASHVVSPDVPMVNLNRVSSSRAF
jgi:hypothetical protein